jgi:glutamyl-tRNA reductase
MWQELALIHRACGKTTRPLQGPGHAWATCLRQILFLPPGEAGWSRTNTLSGDELFIGFSAHRFLLEICSGLHSPLFGETEVFGQFRSFRESNEFHPAWRQLLDALEEDVKKVRRTHLKDLGSQSYGSLVRRHLPESGRVVMAGAGRLARDLLPWLSNHEIFLLARNPDKAARECPGARHILSLDQARQGDARMAGAHWLIAAPLSNADLSRSWEINPAATVLDFRGEERFLRTPEGANAYFDLGTLYGELEGVRRLHDRRRREALDFAAELSSRREVQVWHRPYGWEDAFA